MTTSHSDTVYSPTSRRRKFPKKTLSIVGALAVSVGTLSSLHIDNPYVRSAPGAAMDTRDVPFLLQATHAISIKNLQFDPNAMDMATGDTVTWTNKEEDGTFHNITSDDGSSFVTPEDVPPGGTFSYTPSSPGTYAYHCRIHPQTTATLKVSGEGSAPPPGEPPPPSDPAPPPEDPPPSEPGSILDVILDLIPLAAQRY